MNDFNLSTLLGLVALVVVLLVSTFALGGYGLLISSTLIAVGLADYKPNESNE
jgi:hypothetical protein